MENLDATSLSPNLRHSNTSSHKVIVLETVDLEASQLPSSLFEANSFELLGLKPHIKIDHKQLHRDYIALTRKFHPDRFVQKGSQALKNAQELCTLLNKAYQELKGLESRIYALLCARGFLQKASDGLSQKLPQEFLFEVFEIRECLEELQAQETLEPDQLKNLQEHHVELQAKREQFSEELSSQLESWEKEIEKADMRRADKASQEEQELVQSILVTLGKRRYLDELHDKVKRELKA